MNEKSLADIEKTIQRQVANIRTEIFHDSEVWNLSIVKDIEIQESHYRVEVTYYVYNGLHTIELDFGVENFNNGDIEYDTLTGIGAFRVMNILKQFYLAVFLILHEKVGIDRTAICPTCERRWRFYNRTIRRLLKKIGIDIPIVYI